VAIAGGHRRAAILAVALAAISVASGLAPASSAARAGGQHRALKMIWGTVDLTNGRSAFPIYHQLGVDVFQIELNWAHTAPTRPDRATDPKDPAYDWSAELGQALHAAAHYHIRVCILVLGTPAWANGGLDDSWAPSNPKDFGNFLTAAARRYRSVHYWMVWGEPNRNANFQPMPPNSSVGPRRYALLLNAGYHALKRVSRANVVIGGNTSSYGTVQPADFARWMRLPNGRPPPLDYYGLNPYSARFPKPHQRVCCKGGRDIDDLPAFESEVAHAYHHRVPLWLSEFSISSDENNRAFAFHVSRAAQARWVTAAFRLVNSLDYVAGLGWFNLVDDPPSVPGHLTTGLMTWDLKRKPAFYAFEHAR